MRKEFFFLIIITFFSLNTSAQFTKYIVRFKDKTGTPFSINDPSKFLSARAIERRTKQNIAIGETDLPIVPAYIDSIRSVANVTVLDGSKWLNQICIATTDSMAILKINSFPFVIKTSPLKRLIRQNVAGRNQSPDFVTFTGRLIVFETLVTVNFPVIKPFPRLTEVAVKEMFGNFSA